MGFAEDIGREILQGAVVTLSACRDAGTIQITAQKRGYSFSNVYRARKLDEDWRLAEAVWEVLHKVVQQEPGDAAFKGVRMDER